jgi:hypothetical protein
MNGLNRLNGYPLNYPVNLVKPVIQGLNGYPLIHLVNPVIQLDQSESGQFSDG